MSISNLKKKFIDFVPTISDSEEDIPDYDEESSEDEESELLKQKEESLDDKENNSKKSCLLYTSPSPRDSTSSRMPSSA